MKQVFEPVRDLRSVGGTRALTTSLLKSEPSQQLIANDLVKGTHRPIAKPSLHWAAVTTYGPKPGRPIHDLGEIEWRFEPTDDEE